MEETRLQALGHGGFWAGRATRASLCSSDGFWVHRHPLAASPIPVTEGPVMVPQDMQSHLLTSSEPVERGQCSACRSVSCLLSAVADSRDSLSTLAVRRDGVHTMIILSRNTCWTSETG